MVRTGPSQTGIKYVKKRTNPDFGHHSNFGSDWTGTCRKLNLGPRPDNYLNLGPDYDPKIFENIGPIWTDRSTGREIYDP